MKEPTATLVLQEQLAAPRILIQTLSDIRDRVQNAYNVVES
jgi:hypothetical protein